MEDLKDQLKAHGLDLEDPLVAAATRAAMEIADSLNSDDVSAIDIADWTAIIVKWVPAYMRRS